MNKEIIKSFDFSDIKQKFLDLNVKDANEGLWIFIKNNISFFSESLDWINIIKSTEIYIKGPNDYLNIVR